MATQKFTQPAPAASVTFSSAEAEISALRNSIEHIDGLCQPANERILALTASIHLMLREPDSVQLRWNIKTLVDLIDMQAYFCREAVSLEAAESGAAFLDYEDQQERDRFRAAAGGVL